MGDMADSLPVTHRNRELTEQQRNFVEARVRNSVSAMKAAQIAGYAHPKNMAYELERNPRIMAAMHELRQRLIQTDCANLALDTMKQLMQPGNPGGVRFNAAKYFLDAAGHGAKEQDGEQKSLDEMSPDELAEQIKKLDEALVKIGDQARPVSTMVIENESGTKEA